MRVGHVVFDGDERSHRAALAVRDRRQHAASAHARPEGLGSAVVPGWPLHRVRVPPRKGRRDDGRRSAALFDRGRWRRGDEGQQPRHRRLRAALVPRQRTARLRVVGLARARRRQGTGEADEGGARRQGQGLRRRAQPLPLLGSLDVAWTAPAHPCGDAPDGSARWRHVRRRVDPRPLRRDDLPPATAGTGRAPLRHQSRWGGDRLHARLRPRPARAVVHRHRADGCPQGQVALPDAQLRTRGGAAALFARRSLDRGAFDESRARLQRAAPTRVDPPWRSRHRADDVRLGSRPARHGALVARFEACALPRGGRDRAADLVDRRARVRRCCACDRRAARTASRAASRRRRRGPRGRTGRRDAGLCPVDPDASADAVRMRCGR